MNITSAQYTLSGDGVTKSAIRATIDGVEMHVPLTTENRHYKAILEWVAKGNTIADAE